MAEHPLEQAARQETPGQADRIGWARTAALEAEGRLAAVRALGAATADAEYADAIRAAARSCFVGHRDFGGATAVARAWLERSIQELERGAVGRFGPYQSVVRLGYQPAPVPSGGRGPRSMGGR